MNKRLISILGVAALGAVLGLAGCKKSVEPSPSGTQPIKVGAIFAVTGAASFLGAPEARTAEMLVAKMNEAGGVNGRKIELIVKDSGSSTDKAISLAKQLVDEDQVLAIIGPSTSGETIQIKSVCQDAKTILLSCAAAEGIVNPVLSYVFKVAPNDSDAVRWIYRTMKAKGISKIGVISSNDGFGNAGKGQLEKLAAENGITIAISEVYNKDVTDLTDVLTKSKGHQVQAVVNWSAVPAQSMVARNMKQIGLDVPLFQSHGFGNVKYVQEAGEAANGTLLPCGRILVADALPDSNPQKTVLMEYKTEYEGKYKEDASTFGGHPYDALLVLTEAIRKAGSTDPEKVRDAIENLKGVVGTAGVFNFSPRDHGGLGMDAFEMLTVKDGKFAIYKN